MKKILYIGNNLAKSSDITTLSLLSRLLTIEGFDITISSSKKNKLLRLLDMCWSVIRYRSSIDYLLIDTFSTTNFYYAYVTSQLASIFKIKYIPILHGGNLPIRLQKSPSLSKSIFSNSHKNIAPSNYLKTAFEAQGFQTDFIPNILEIEKYQFKQRDPLQPNLLWVRAFKTLYNPTLAIKVLAIVKKKYPNAKLCMIGPQIDSSFTASVALVKKHQLESSVTFTGVLPKQEWHQKAKEYDIFINTTNFDNTPVSVMEAMALGLPVVSTNAGGMPFLIKDGIDGLLVAKDQPENMATAICRLIEDNNQEMLINARLKAESFAWNVVKNKWLQILK